MQPRTGPAPAREIASATPPKRRPVRSILDEVDRDQIIQALKQADGRVGGPNGAASRLGLKRTTLITRMKKLGIGSKARSASDRPVPDAPDSSDRSTNALPGLDEGGVEFGMFQRFSCHSRR